MKKIVVLLSLFLLVFSLNSCGNSNIKKYKNETSATEFKSRFDQCFNDVFGKNDKVGKDFVLTVIENQELTDYFNGEAVGEKVKEYKHIFEYDSETARCNSSEISLINGEEKVNIKIEMQIYNNDIYNVYENGEESFKKAYSNAEKLLDSMCSLENDFIGFYNYANTGGIKSDFYYPYDDYDNRKEEYINKYVLEFRDVKLDSIDLSEYLK